MNRIFGGPRESEGVGGFVEAMARQKNKSNKEIEEEFFKNVRPSSEAVCDRGRNRSDRDVPG